MEWGFTWVLVLRFWFGHVRCSGTALPGTALPGTALPQDRPSPGPPFPWTAQKFRFFFPLPPQNSFFSSLSGGGLLVEFWCEAAGVSHHSPRAQTCTIKGPGLHKNHQNSTRRYTVSDKNRAKGDGKKTRNFVRFSGGGSAGRGPAEGGPGEGCPAQRGPNHTTNTNYNHNNKEPQETTNTHQHQQIHPHNNTDTTTTTIVQSGEAPF